MDKNIDKKLQKEAKFSLSSEIKILTITAIFLSLSMLFKFLGSFIIITGYPLEIELIIYLIGLISINNWRYCILFLLTAPLLWVLIVPPIAFNFFQIFVEYFLPQFCFILIPIIFIFIKKQKIYWIIFILSFVIIFVYIIKCLLHVVAGYFWWTSNDLALSFLINLRIIGTNLAIQLPISIILLFSIFKNDQLMKLFFSQNFLKIIDQKLKINQQNNFPSDLNKTEDFSPFKKEQKKE